jgi:hypothetical protein
MRDITGDVHMRSKKLSNHEKAVKRVEDVMLRHARVMVAYSALDRTNVTVGPYRTAVGCSEMYAVTLRGNIRTFADAENAAAHFVSTVGFTRALGAVIAAVGTQQNKEYIDAGT